MSKTPPSPPPMKKTTKEKLLYLFLGQEKFKPTDWYIPIYWGAVLVASGLYIYNRNFNPNLNNNNKKKKKKNEEEQHIILNPRKEFEHEKQQQQTQSEQVSNSEINPGIEEKSKKTPGLDFSSSDGRRGQEEEEEEAAAGADSSPPFDMSAEEMEEKVREYRKEKEELVRRAFEQFNQNKQQAIQNYYANEQEYLRQEQQTKYEFQSLQQLQSQFQQQPQPYSGYYANKYNINSQFATASPPPSNSYNPLSQTYYNNPPSPSSSSWVDMHQSAPAYNVPFYYTSKYRPWLGHHRMQFEAYFGISFPDALYSRSHQNLPLPFIGDDDE